MSLRQRIASAFFAPIIEQQVSEALKVYDDQWWRKMGTQDTTSLEPDSPIKAYHENPLAFRIVHILVNHVLGEGIIWEVDDQATSAWLSSWWHHPLNRMDNRIRAWLAELILTGDLFPTFHTNNGITAMRAIPSSSIDEIKSNPQDLEDELAYHEVGDIDNPDGTWWQAARHGGNMMHFAINRPVGQLRGLSDLATVIPWLKRYSTWLKGRVAINKAKGAFVYDVMIKGTAADVARRRSELAVAPKSGSVIIHNEAEEWKSVSAHIDAGSAEADGKALRLMIAAGVGIPLHFLSEGESATKATAREMGEPTRRSFAERQKIFGSLLQSVAQEAARRASQSASLSSESVSCIPAPRFPDLTREDNFFLAQAASQIVTALTTATEKGWLSDDEASRWLRKFAGETNYGIQ